MEPSSPTHPFTSADLADLGLTHYGLERLVASGSVRRIFNGGYLPDGIADTITTRARLAARLLAPGHVISGRTAAWIHGVDTYAWAELGTRPNIDACALPDAERSRRRGVHGHNRDLSPHDITQVEGVRLTTPLRTAMDLGCLLRPREALAALDAFARHHGITTTDLREELPRFKGRRGVRQLRSLLPLIDGQAESPRESWTRYEMLAAGLPQPTLQYWVEVDGVPTYRLDLAYPHRRVAVEYDGYDAHERSPEQREKDRQRRRWLREHGWTIIVIRRGGFTPPDLGIWLQKVRQALTAPYSPVRKLERGPVRG